MKSRIILILYTILFFTFQSFAETKIISNLGVLPDFTFEGAKGINLTFQYNFHPIYEQTHNDTILQDCTFTLKVKLVAENKTIGAAKGYQFVENSQNELEYTITLSGTDLQATKVNKKTNQFIPYAALQLPEGVHAIKVQTSLNGKDVLGNEYHQNFEKNSITITKPATQLFTMNIDHIEVKPFTSNGQAWDYAFFKTDAPDVGVNIMVGNTTVYKKNVNDSYMFAAGPDSRNIVFTISKNDKVVVKIQDIDVLFHDFVAKWVFSTNKMPGVTYTYKKPTGNVKSCLLTFRYE